MRVGISVILFTLITFYFLDFAGLLPNSFHWLAQIQFVPALLSLSVIILAILVILTLFFGRIYCSTICPMGFFQDIISRFSRHFGKKKKKYSYSPAKNILRWSVTGFVLITFLLGFTLFLSLLDPYSAYGRMIANVFKPVYMSGNNLLESIFSQFNNYTFYRVDVLIRSVLAFCVGMVTFLAIGFLAWQYGRTYCNTVCPVGTVLGFISKYAFFKVRIDATKCNKCGLCATKCKASCIDSKEHSIDYSRCVDCFNCLDSCKQKAISFAPALQQKSTVIKAEGISDASQRQFLITTFAMAVIMPKTFAQNKIAAFTSRGKEYKREHPLSPPGSISAKHLLSHCTACHLCVSKCPSHILKPALIEYGLGGIMQPVMNYEKGFCNFDCTVCGDICPNGAIKPLTIQEKHLTQVGKVVFIKDNCIVHTDGTSCGACSEHCPTQAVSMVPYKNGLTIPSVNPDICVGCGGCEYVCPVRPYRAIHVEGNVVHKQALAFKETEKKTIKVDDFGF